MMTGILVWWTWPSRSPNLVRASRADMVLLIAPTPFAHSLYQCQRARTRAMARPRRSRHRERHTHPVSATVVRRRHRRQHGEADGGGQVARAVRHAALTSPV